MSAKGRYISSAARIPAMIARVCGLLCHALPVDDGWNGSQEDIPAATRPASRGLSQKQLQPNVMGVSNSPSSAGIRAWGDLTSRMVKATLQNRGTDAPAMAGRRTFTSRIRTKENPPEGLARPANGVGQLRLTASSYAARRLGQATIHSRVTQLANSPDFSFASWVSISELLGVSHPRRRVPERAIS